MDKTKIGITIDTILLQQLDRLVAEEHFPSRSCAIQQAVQEKIAYLERGRLARECTKLDPAFEKRLADEGLDSDNEQWSEH